MKYSLRSLMIVITLSCVALGVGIWAAYAQIEHTKQERIRWALEAHRAEIANANASFGTVEFNDNQLLSSGPLKEEDFYGFWRCVNGESELVLELSKDNPVSELDFSGKLHIKIPSRLGGKSFHHQGLDKNRQRLVFKEVTSEDFGVLTKGECVLTGRNLLLVRAEFLHYRNRIKVDSIFVRVDEDNKPILP